MTTRHLKINATDGIPILARCQALVAGGALAGCVAALSLAKAGRKVIIAAPGCSLPRDISEYRRPWISDDDLARLPYDLRGAFNRCVSHNLDGGGYLLNLAKLSVDVEDLLIDAGVSVFYGMHPCGAALGADGSISAVIFGGKFGLRAIAANDIIDATPDAMIATLAGVPLKKIAPRDRRVMVAISAKVGVASDDLPITGDRGQRNECPADWPDEKEFIVPGIDALVDGRVALRGPYAEFIFDLPVDPSDPFIKSDLAKNARLMMIEAGEKIALRRKKAGERPLFFHRFSGGLLTELLFDAPDGRTLWHPNIENLWISSPAANAEGDEARRPADPYAGYRRAEKIAAEILKEHRASADSVHLSLTATKTSVACDSNARLLFSDSPPLHATGEDIDIGEAALPVIDECETLVVGGGTSGVPAAIASAETGAKTILLEQNSDVGGVRTVGGVGSYWFGRETRCQLDLDSRYDEVSERSGMAEELAMLRVLIDAGVDVRVDTPTVGGLRDGDRVIGVVVATGHGLGIILAKTIVDATGDADIAAWAGAPFEYGNGRDEWTIWGSFANFNKLKRTANRQYESAIEIRDPHDVARTIIRGRRRQGMWSKLAHETPQLYVTPRESRRIAGRAAVTYRGILAGETFPDVMIVCESNFDIKGIATSDALRCGLVWSWNFQKNFRQALPYRAVLPIGIENLIVAGRAYSASHDAMTLGRMQRDMVSLGYAAGIAAALSAKGDTPPGALDIASLQEEWIRRGALTAKDLRRWGKPPAEFTAEDAERETRLLLAGNVKAQLRLARLIGSKESIQPLRRAFDSLDGGALKTKIARALCLLGDATGVPYLLESIAAQIAGGLPRPHRRALAIPPEHGYAPDPVYSLHAIAIAEEGRRAAGLLRDIAARIPEDEAAFASKTDSPFEYVRAICSVAERDPGAWMILALETLLAKKSLCGKSIPYNADMRLTLDPVGERLAYLELCVGRALARCADRRGFDILLEYVDDVRGTFAGSAVVELSELLGAPPRSDRLVWERLLAARREGLNLAPYLHRIE